MLTHSCVAFDVQVLQAVQHYASECFLVHNLDTPYSRAVIVSRMSHVHLTDVVDSSMTYPPEWRRAGVHRSRAHVTMLQWSAGVLVVCSLGCATRTLPANLVPVHSLYKSIPAVQL